VFGFVKYRAKDGGMFMTVFNKAVPDISSEVDVAVEKTRGISGEVEPMGEREGEATGRRGLSLLTEPLGLFGWSELETVLLAAVASETPLLLVGSHGCAKSYFLEHLAKVLELEYRFYNASLINYDDLVGIPMPSEDRKRLEYITTPTAIWDAEVVFLDEINRTKPELQNKLFPIIHERRVQGVPLKRLRFRWAAINPPPSETDYDEVAYLGAEPLDTALADRFGFIVEVPSWNGLHAEDKMSVLRNRGRGPRTFPVPIEQLISACRTRLDQLQDSFQTDLGAYLVLLWNELVKAGVTLSTRRLSMLYDNILATHAAAATLETFSGEAVRQDWNLSAWQALQHSLPQRAQGTAPEMLKINAAHLQAWALMNKTQDSEVFSLLTISDKVARAREALRHRHRLPEGAVSSALIQFLSESDGPADAHIRALALYTVTHCQCPLPAPVLDAMANQLEGIFSPAAFPVPVPWRDRDYVSKLMEEIPAATGPRECMLRHYDQNLAKRIYELTHDVQDSKRAVQEFRLLIKKLGPAKAVRNGENHHA